MRHNECNTKQKTRARPETSTSHEYSQDRKAYVIHPRNINRWDATGNLLLLRVWIPFLDRLVMRINISSTYKFFMSFQILMSFSPTKVEKNCDQRETLFRSLNHCDLKRLNCLSLLMFCVVWDYPNSKLTDKQYKQKTPPKIYQNKINFSPIQGY